MNKKLLSATALAAAAALALAGCGGSDEPAGSDNEINVLFWNWGADAESGWRSIADDFTSANPQTTVKLTPVAGDNWGTYLSNASTMIAGGAAPDLMYTATEGVKFLIENDLIAPLDDKVAADPDSDALLADMADNLLDGMRSDGKLYGMPYAWNNMVIYYNTERFAEAGLATPDASWTLDDFTAAAKALTVDANNDGTPEKYGYAWAGNELFPGITPWVFNFGGSLTTPDLCEPTVNSPEVVEAVQYLYDLIHVDKVSPAPSPLSEVFPQFQNGDVAMFGAGRWPLASLIPEGFTAFDIQMFPKVKEQITEFGVGGFTLLKSSKHSDAAWNFLKFTASPEIQGRMVGTQDSPATDIPALRSVAEQLPAPPANSSLFYSSIDNGEAALVPAPTRFNEFESTLLRSLTLIWAGEISVKDGLDQAQKELESIVTFS